MIFQAAQNKATAAVRRAHADNNFTYLLNLSELELEELNDLPELHMRGIINHIKHIEAYDREPITNEQAWAKWEVYKQMANNAAAIKAAA